MWNGFEIYTNYQSNLIFTELQTLFEHSDSRFTSGKYIFLLNDLKLFLTINGNRFRCDF